MPYKPYPNPNQQKPLSPEVGPESLIGGRLSVLFAALNGSVKSINMLGIDVEPVEQPSLLTDKPLVYEATPDSTTVNATQLDINSQNGKVLHADVISLNPEPETHDQLAAARAYLKSITTDEAA